MIVLRLLRSTNFRYAGAQVGHQIRNSSSVMSVLFLREQMRKVARYLISGKPLTELGYDISTDTVMPTRLVRDSCCDGILPLSTDPDLQEAYSIVDNSIRFGKIMEDLDLFAVWVALRHASGGEASKMRTPYFLTTLALDRIDVTDHPMTISDDVHFSGKVTWVGNTSMEVTVDVGQAGQTVMTAKFVMVAYQVFGEKKVKIHGLELQTEEERRLFQLGVELRAKRKLQAEKSLLKVVPTVEESADIHKLFLQIATPGSLESISELPTDCRWMEDAVVESAVSCFPEQRNLSSVHMFGGFLMRQSFELAEINATKYSGQQPRILFVDDIHFRVPVPIGSQLFYKSQVGYTKDRQMMVNVRANVLNPKTGTSKTTNVFHYVFGVLEPVPTVLPRSYAESMLYIDSRRHFYH